MNTRRYTLLLVSMSVMTATVLMMFGLSAQVQGVGIGLIIAAVAGALADGWE